MPDLRAHLRTELLSCYHKAHTTRLTHWVGTDPERLQALVSLFLATEYRVTQRAASVLGKVADQHPALLEPHLPQAALHADASVAVKRNVVRLLQHTALPEELQGAITEQCFTYLENPKEAIAVRAFSISVLTRICQQQPELTRELLLVLDNISPGAGPALRVRSREARKALGPQR